ncbi:MAG: hypothetical protein V1775_19315 [Bacteroidota bacterium]
MRKTHLFTHFFCFSVVFLFLSISIFAQQDSLKMQEMKGIRKNSVYLELLGNGAVYSFNYDRIIMFKKGDAMFLRLGGNEYHGIKTSEPSYNLIFAAGLLNGGPRHFFEAGSGFTWFSNEPDRLIVLSTGYRYQGRKGLLFRATPMYIINTEKGDTFGNCPWFGLSFGYAF